MTKETLNFKLDLEEKSTWLFISSTLDVKNNLPFIQELGNFYCKKDYFTQRKNLDSFYISYTISGSAKLEYNNEIASIKPFQLFWIDCNNYQRYWTNPETENWNQIWVHFYGPSCREYYDLFIRQNNGSNIINLPTQNHIPDKLEQLISMYKHSNNNFSTDIVATSILVEIMTRCIFATTQVDNLNPLPDFIIDAMLYIQENYNDKITLDVLSEKFLVNKYYFHKTFKKHLGITPNNYLITIRLNKAKELLRTTTMQINQIASFVGIDNVSHFINTFKKHEGVTPYDYSKTWYWK